MWGGAAPTPPSPRRAPVLLLFALLLLQQLRFGCAQRASCRPAELQQRIAAVHDACGEEMAECRTDCRLVVVPFLRDCRQSLAAAEGGGALTAVSEVTFSFSFCANYPRNTGL
eukprot:SAG31_NODE_8595_length_1423_cov_1.577039_2_plen_113_part_00